MFAAVGPVSLPTEPGPDAFWSAVERYYGDAAAALASHPQLAALVRGWLAASDNPALARAQHEMEQAVMPWIERILDAGRAVGAVRTDLPSGLLIAVALGMGRAMDTWLMAQPLEGTVPPPIGPLVGMLRRALQPSPVVPGTDPFPYVPHRGSARFGRNGVRGHPRSRAAAFVDSSAGPRSRT